jgi:hypothetical protein
MREPPQVLSPQLALTEYIMPNSCDSITLKGTTKLASAERSTYGHAQKMRAAVTYTFGWLHGLGDMPWHESEVPGSPRMLGNPSISVQVSTYMCSLRRRKVSLYNLTGAEPLCGLANIYTTAISGSSWRGCGQCPRHYISEKLHQLCPKSEPEADLIRCGATGFAVETLPLQPPATELVPSSIPAWCTLSSII